MAHATDRAAVLITSIVAAGMLLVAGCQQFDLSRRIPWKTSKETRTEPPGKIVVAWIDAVRHQAGRRPVRGFGGRVYFYGRDEKEPIEVDGKIVVYAFDESDRGSNNAVPDRKYVFPAVQVAKLQSESPLGNSYNLWIPWDEVGGVQKEISLIVRFEPTEGSVVVGNQTTNLLPGSMVTANVASARAGPTNRAHGESSPAVQPAGFQSPPVAQESSSASTPSAPTQGTSTHMTTTTISVDSRRGRSLPVARRQRQARRKTPTDGLRQPNGSPAERHVTTADPLPAEPRREAGFPLPTLPVPAGPIVRRGIGRERWPPSLATRSSDFASRSQFPVRQQESGDGSAAPGDSR